MDYSIVTTLYNSEKSVQKFYERIVSAVKKIQIVMKLFSLMMASCDASLRLVIDIASSDFSCKVVDLSRNFGHHKALMTGLEHVK